MPTPITFENTLDDLVALMNALPATRLSRRAWIRPAIILAFCLLVASQAAIADSGLVTVIGLLVAGPVLAGVVHRVNVSAVRRSLARTASAAGVLGRRTLTLTDDGVVVSTAHGENRLRWDALDVRRTDRHVFLIAGEGVGLAIPVAALGAVAEVDAFVADVRRRLPSSGGARPLG
jgi:hypothetical protein